jgi:phage T7 capsid assembly protein|nr:MAG TPA: capsid assembly protein [Caudoviricetes sp.]
MADTQPQQTNQNPQSGQPPAPDMTNATVTTTDTGVIVDTTKPEVPLTPEPQTPPAGEDSPQTPPEGDSTQQLQTDFQQQQVREGEIKDTLTKSGIDFDALAAEYDKDGALSAESLAALEKAGYPKAVVDAYLAGLDALADRYVQEVKNLAGGEENYARLIQFIGSQPQNVIDGFNAAIQTGNIAQIQLALAGVQAQMTAAYGTANPSVMAGAQGAGTPTGYQTTAEMTKDMSDPRYQTDPAFTQEVYRKIQYSSLF